MRLFPAILFVLTVSTSFAALDAQAPANLQVVPTPAISTPSAFLSPAVDSIQQALTIVRPDKWKISSEANQQTQANLTSIQTDLQTTLPTLLTAADQHPNSAVQVLPAYRNVEALYDVLLRVTQVATLAAPTQQIVALQEAMDKLERGRRALGDSIQSSALNQEQQTRDLQAQLHTLQSTPPPPPVVCAPPPAPVKKRKPAAKPAPKPAAAAATPAAH
jgi:hypothetical protein